MPLDALPSSSLATSLPVPHLCIPKPGAFLTQTEQKGGDTIAPNSLAPNAPSCLALIPTMDVLFLRIIRPNSFAQTPTFQSDTRQRIHGGDRRIGSFFLLRMYVTLYTKGGCISILYLSQNSVCRPHGTKQSGG